MVDLHSHLVPAVDDGASGPEEARRALRALVDQGVERVVVTPHLNAQLTLSPDPFNSRMAELDVGFELLKGIACDECPGVRIERGAEIALDTPRPDFSDPRIRLAGGRWVLVEFSRLMIPPRSTAALAEILAEGYRPLLAHPERYPLRDLGLVAEWREAGVALQVNAGSLLGKYGPAARKVARELLARGWVDVVASDYHARGAPPIAPFVEWMDGAGGAEQRVRLTVENPALILQGEDVLPVDPLPEKRRWWSVLVGG
jgi:protein-tyrosine phosphatase